MPSRADQLRTNLTGIRNKVAAAAARSGRPPEAIRIIAVTKYASDEAVAALPETGLTDFGEARPQQLIERASRTHGIQWHLIGHLQRNKVRAVLPCVALIHSIDSLKLLERIGQIASELKLCPQALLEVNVSGEVSKDGFSPGLLREQWTACREIQSVDVCGLMTMAPLNENPTSARTAFRALRELRDQLRAECGDPGALPELSMGMSGDFEVGIEEGATLVRIGSAIFEGVE
jgi:pyridoxal phosphate enzyme (YggS family)